MMESACRRASRSGWVALIALLAGCGSLPPPALYTLDGDRAVEAVACVPDQPVLAVVPVTLPEYADRDQLVSRVGPHALALDDDNHWAERPSVAMTRLLAAALARVGPYCVGSARASGTTVELRLALSQFDFASDGAAHIAGLWQLIRSVDDGIVLSGAIDRRQAATSSAPGGRVAAMNAVVLSATDAIAEAVARARPSQP